MHYQGFFGFITSELFNRGVYRGSIFLTLDSKIISVLLWSNAQISFHSKYSSSQEYGGSPSDCILCGIQQDVQQCLISVFFSQLAAAVNSLSEVVLLLKSMVAEHPASHCRGRKESSREQPALCSLPSFFHTRCSEPVLEGGQGAVFQQVLSLLHTALCAFGGWIPLGLATDVSPFCTISFDVLVTLKMLQSSSKCRRP